MVQSYGKLVASITPIQLHKPKWCHPNQKGWLSEVASYTPLTPLIFFEEDEEQSLASALLARQLLAKNVLFNLLKSFKIWWVGYQFSSLSYC